jgi:hypothetical protein
VSSTGVAGAESSNRVAFDLVYYSSQHSTSMASRERQRPELEYDFVVSPGADPNQIQLSFTGADSVRLDPAGNLVLQTGDTEIRQSAPYIYQDINGTRQQVAGEFRIENSEFSGTTDYCLLTTVYFELGPYDPTRLLVIDPVVLSYSTYLGGSGSEEAWDIAVDSSGQSYVTGQTYSPNFPVFDPWQPSNAGGGDVFVAKFSPSGSTLAYATYLGGSVFDRGHGIAVGKDGSAFITGITESDNFPTTPGTYQSSCAGVVCHDAFITRLSVDGSQLMYSTFLGGQHYDYGDDVAVDTGGNAYVKGLTMSANFPTVNAAQPQYGGGGWCTEWIDHPCTDVFVTKLNRQGSALVYSTYLGGNRDEGYFSGDGGIAVDPAGHAYVTGETWSQNFPAYNAIQPTFNGGTFDAFVTKLSPEGSAFVYSGYLGGNNAEAGQAIAADALGNAYVTGYTHSNNFPTTANSFQPSFQGESDAFITKLNPAGSVFVYSTYFGGSLWDRGYGIGLDKAGNAYIGGWTYSTNLPIVLAFQAGFGGTIDAFVAKLSSGGHSLMYSSYLGGSSSEYGNGIAVDGLGNAYVAGLTNSTNFPTLKPFQPVKAGIDAFVTKISRFGLASARPMPLIP